MDGPSVTSNDADASSRDNNTATSNVPKTIAFAGASASAVMNRFGAAAPMVLGAAVIYWFMIFAATVVLTEKKLGLDDANRLAAVVATVSVFGSTILYVRHVCNLISSSRIAVDDKGVTIRAVQLWRANEYHFCFHEIDRIIYGQRLNGVERFLNQLDELGVSSASQGLNKDLKSGRLFVFQKSGERTAFQFVNKAFDDAQLLAFFEVLDSYGVQIGSGK